MKNTKRIAAALAAALTLTAALSGCGGKTQTPDPTPAPTEAATPAPTEAPQETPAAAPEGVRVAPIPSGFDPLNLEDCVLQVSFTNDDIALNDEGKLMMHLTVWEQELFDAVDVNTLKPGDTLVVRGEDIAVAEVAREGSIVRVNGGAEAGGVSLAPSESGGTFYESNEDVIDFDANYAAVAQMTLPVDGDNFLYTDYSDPTLSAGETYMAGDLLIMKDEVDFSTTAMNGSAHIVNSQITEITRSYMP